ncbi:hypothetical protein CEXT_328281 [Caerostris extrusa]|uniref:Uncharacterized protein n=1 Tax=Caerostris extrusa TaxID=172846 RepID=A0AAV4QS86_CAEEX|nr:hypothetical protein CEXT_328281 [Caerostris extrusa]
MVSNDFKAEENIAEGAEPQLSTAPYHDSPGRFDVLIKYQTPAADSNLSPAARNHESDDTSQNYEYIRATYQMIRVYQGYESDDTSQWYQGATSQNQTIRISTKTLSVRVSAKSDDTNQH